LSLEQTVLKICLAELNLKLLYSILFYIALPFILIRLVWRGIRAPSYWQRWSERFGYSPLLSDKTPVIWIHAVSVGEVEATRPLIKTLFAEYPQHQIIVTTMTPTGSARVKLLYGETVAHCYLPYDVSFAVRRFLKQIHPQFGIIMETEIWPTLLLTCQQLKIPLVLANARMSERSAKGYARFADFTKTILQSLHFIATQTETDRQRFKQLGADIRNVHAIGNLKYEISLPIGLMDQATAMRSLWGSYRPVWVAASTHEGEETIILNASRQVRAACPDLLLIIVPRHPERFDRVSALSHKLGFKTLRRSEQRPCPAEVKVMVVDTMGELPLFYAASDVAFVGGSLVPVGGHNILEPAALARPIITGPHYFNFNEITQQFLKTDAAIKINNTEELAKAVIKLLQNPQQRAKMGDTALQLMANSQGASKRLVNLIKRHITHHAH
jgi:3-deoxy-D-manno-octulosonic-acid transferase